jgi:deoxyribodipyrimidine photo-lyase
MPLLWHRNDLRTSDNHGLSVAADTGEVVPVFVFDPEVLEYASPPRVAFMLEALDSLRDRYRELGSDLCVRTGDPVTELVDLAGDHDVSSVVWNRDYSGLARDRDQRVEAALGQAGYSTESCHDRLFHVPGELVPDVEAPVEVYDDFWRRLRPRQGGPRYEPPDPSGVADVSGGEMPDLETLGFDAPLADVPAGGEAAAQEALETFCADRIYGYDTAVQRPGEGTVSRLSDHIRWGTISVRQVYAGAEGAREGATVDADHTAIETFKRQLGWRDYYYHVLYHDPNAVSQGHKSPDAGIDWRNDDAEFEAWTDGRTGYPLVDAGMRQLRQEAHMHNTVRVAVASFLTKHLHVDWRRGYRWFRRNLVDHDPANDSGGWQWAASTGLNVHEYAAFEPGELSRKHDPDAEYIKEYVPELADVDPETIHEWPDTDEEIRERVAPEYPAPIVDGDTRLEQARRMYDEIYPELTPS